MCPASGSSAGWSAAPRRCELAWSEHRHKMVAALAQVLAEELQVEVTDPEPLVAARALTGLVELLYDSRLRHAGTAGRPDELLARVNADIERGARLLDTGMWSLHLIAEGRRTKEQIREAASRRRAGTPAGAGRPARRQAGVETGSPAGTRRRPPGAPAGARGSSPSAPAGQEAARQAHQQAQEAARQAHQQAQRLASRPKGAPAGERGAPGSASGSS